MQSDTTYTSYRMKKAHEKERKLLGSKIREIRQLKGMTQEALGDRADLSYKFLGELERGNVNVSLDSLASIAKALGVQIVDLFKSGKDSVLKVTVKEKTPYSKLSPQDHQAITKALKLLNRTFPQK